MSRVGGEGVWASRNTVNASLYQRLVAGLNQSHEELCTETDHRLYAPCATYNSHNPLDFTEGILLPAVRFVFLLASFRGWGADEKKRRCGLLFWPLIWAGVTTVSVIKPVLITRFN